MTIPAKVAVANYRSKYEKRFAKLCERPFVYEGESIEWQPPVKQYKPDFIFQKKDGGTMYVELKGVFLPADRSKMKCVTEQYPNLDIRMLFQRASNTLSKKSNTTYGDWCDKNGIKWAEGDRLPVSWLNEIAK